MLSLRPITSLYHGIFDYIVGIVLLLAPNIFGFVEVGGAAVAIPRIIGAGILLQSLMTEYELGIANVISMKTHLMNDYAVGIFLAVSPWLFGFHDLPKNAWMPDILVGLAIIATSMLSEPFARQSNIPGGVAR